MSANKFSKYSLSLGSVGIIALTLLLIRFCFPPNNPINFDVFGYYLYLPFSFIYHDLGLHNFSQLQQLFDAYQPSVSLYQVSPGLPGFWVMKYSMGMAILYAPFFFVSHFVALITAYPADGFSLPYQWGILTGSTVYTLLGIYFLRKVLLKFFSDKVAAITLLLLFFGSNYFDQSVFNAEISHNYLFTLYTLIFWLTIQWHENHKRKYLILLAVFMGVIVLARPTEIIAFFIPLLWGVYDKNSLKAKLKLLWQFKFHLLLFIGIILLIGSLQLLYWKVYSGHLFFYSYTNAGEGMDFLAPHTFQSLFSFRKGWLIYTPLMVFAITGFYFVYKKKRDIFLPLIVFFILNVYLVSSWSCWWYANCISQRALVQSYVLMAIPLGFFVNQLDKMKRIYKLIFSIILIALVALNLFQIWQFKNHIISGDRMTFSYYKEVFGKTSVSSEDQKLLLVNRWLEGDEHLKDESGYKSRILTAIDFENPTERFRKYCHSDFVYSGDSAFRFDSSLLYFNVYEKSFEALTNYDHAWIRVEFYVYPSSKFEQKDFSLVMQFSHKTKAYKYRGENLVPLLKNKTLVADSWQKVSFDYLTPEVRSEKDELKIYFWNKGRGQLLMDDISVRIFEPIQ